LAKLIGHGGKNTVVLLSHCLRAQQFAQAVQEPYGLTPPERSLRHAVAATYGVEKQKDTAGFQIGMSKTGKKAAKLGVFAPSTSKNALHLPFRSDTYAAGAGVNPARQPPIAAFEEQR
jgi:hypothetical protein